VKDVAPYVLAVALVFAALPMQAQDAPPQILKIAAGSEASRQVMLAPVRYKRVAPRINATATIEPDASAVAHITSRIPARVVKLIAEPGQQVKPGEPLAILSSVELGQTKTEYLKARSLESITKLHLKREQELYMKKIAPMKDLLEARAQYDTALAQYKAARETLRLLIPAKDLGTLDWSENGHPISEFPFTSPITGTLVRRDLTIGAMVDRNDHEPLTVIDLDRIWVLASVFEHDLAALKVGDNADVIVDAYPGKVFTGRVAYIGDEVDRTTRAVLARIEVLNPGHLLKPGMFAHAAIDAGSSREVLVAPDSAIYEIDGQKVAFVAAGPNNFRVCRVNLGSADDGTVEVLSGLRKGDQVVSKGGLTLKSLLANQTD
jgi:cobalt-zinc-cadmium efflux system membrane fusion protein